MTKILIVENDAIVAEDLAYSLERKGYEVAAKCSTGEAAINLANQLKPDLVLMDIRLPGDLDGIEASQEIRTLLDIPVVYLTAYVEKDVSR